MLAAGRLVMKYFPYYVLVFTGMVVSHAQSQDTLIDPKSEVDSRVTLTHDAHSSQRSRQSSGSRSSHHQIPVVPPTNLSSKPDHVAGRHQQHGRSSTQVKHQESQLPQWYRSHTGTHQKRTSGRHQPSRVPQKTPKDRRPNIVLILTDDQDAELGSLNYMPRLSRLMREGGAFFSHAFTSTPMCCPSRSSLLTGMYIHNHEVYTNNDNCSSTRWQQTHELKTFATYLNDVGYQTGYFGKYLNKYNGSHVPVGWREWAGLVMNSRYYNYTVRRNGHSIKFGDKYPQDYYPHVITKDGLHFLRMSKRIDSSPPIMMMLSYPSPHGPEDSAPEHATLFFNATDHHTVAYNYAPNPDKQWMLQFTGRMDETQKKFTDLLMTKRLQTLQTIDEAVQKVIDELSVLGELENTYIFYTSDHGYHLGQFGLVKGKSMPFEFDIRVPFMVRGPGIIPGTEIPHIALNVDLAATFLDIAGVPRPPQMDGRSLLPLLQHTNPAPTAIPWRSSFLVESSGRHRDEEALEQRKKKRKQRLGQSGDDGTLFTSKHERLEIVCKDTAFSSPCQLLQKWECVRDGTRWRMQKCRSKIKWRSRNCICEPNLGMGYLVKLDPEERRKQKNFLKKHGSQDLKKYAPKFIKAFNDVNSAEIAVETLERVQRHSKWMAELVHFTKRSKRGISNDSILLSDVMDYEDESDESVDAFVREEEFRAIDIQISDIYHELESLESSENMSIRNGNSSSNSSGSLLLTQSEAIDIVPVNALCHTSEKGVGCRQEIYSSHSLWKSSKAAVDGEIRLLRDQLTILKEIRKHLQISRPKKETDKKKHKGGSDISNLNDKDIDTELDVEDNFQTIGDYVDGDENSMMELGSSAGDDESLGDFYNNTSSISSIIVVDNDGPKGILSNSDIYGHISVNETEESVTNLHVRADVATSDAIVENVNTAGEVLSNASQLVIPKAGLREIILFSNLNNSISNETITESWKNMPASFKDLNDSGVIEASKLNSLNLAGNASVELNKSGSQKIRKSSKPTFGIIRNSSLAFLKGKGSMDVLRTQHIGHTNALEEIGGLQESQRPKESSNLHPKKTYQNETMKPICWCDRRAAIKLALQKERERKRVERQRIKAERLKRKERKLRKKLKTVLAECDVPKLNCYTHDNDHWRTPPLWQDGPFCFCMNAANNTYWCLRTINTTDNYLYCEFITGLVTYYDLSIDPYELRNVAFTLSSSQISSLHSRLEQLRNCSGADNCDDLQVIESRVINSPARKTYSPKRSKHLIDNRMNHRTEMFGNFSKLRRPNENSDFGVRRRSRKGQKRKNHVADEDDPDLFPDVIDFRSDQILPHRKRHNDKRRKSMSGKKNLTTDSIIPDLFLHT